MTDFGEQVLTGMHFHDGETGATMHNAYSIDYQKATDQAVHAFEATPPGPHHLLLQPHRVHRHAGLGGLRERELPGRRDHRLHRLVGPAVDRAGHAEPGGGRRARVHDRYRRLPRRAQRVTDSGLFTRWAEASALTPYFRVHNSSTTGVRMPWSYDAPTLATYEQMARLHAAALPYLNQLWAQFQATGSRPSDRSGWAVRTPRAPGRTTPNGSSAPTCWSRRY